MVGTLVTVAAFDNVFEAGYWRGLLEAQGVPVVQTDTEICAAEWQIAGAVGSIKLQVPDAEALRATGILDALRKEHPYRPPEESEARRALRVSFLGLLFPPLQLYAMWLLVRLSPRWKGLDQIDRRRVRIAALLDLWLLVVIVAWFEVAS